MIAILDSAAANDPHSAIALLGLGAIFVAALVAGLRWFVSGPARPDPWEGQGSADLPASDDCVLCHHCLVPNAATRDFCENCGAPIGTYTNLLPYPYLFSVGYVLRLGTSGDFKRTPVTIAGYILLAFAEYVWFAPVYLFQFFRRVGMPQEQPSKQL